MKQEKSCGAIVYNGDQFLLLKYERGHWGFPKGHVEEDDEKKTAEREVQEETGISDLEFDNTFRETISYTYKAAGVIRQKEVVFFLAETKTKDVTLSHEHKGFKWLTFNEALEQITYEDECEVLKKVQAHWKSHDTDLKKFF